MQMIIIRRSCCHAHNFLNDLKMLRQFCCTYRAIDMRITKWRQFVSWSFSELVLTTIIALVWVCVCMCEKTSEYLISMFEIQTNPMMRHTIYFPKIDVVKFIDVFDQANYVELPEKSTKAVQICARVFFFFIFLLFFR